MRRSFTLLEVLVVLTILAMITAVTAVRLEGPYQAARLEDAVRRCAFIDSRTRAHARAVGASCEIVVSLDGRRIHARRKSGDGGQHFAFAFPRVLSVRRVVTPEMETESGTAHIEVSSRGASVAYALCLASSQGVERWLVFSGMTGRVMYPKDASDVRELFEMLRAAGNDAH